MKKVFRIVHDRTFNSLAFDDPAELQRRFVDARLGPFGGLYTGCLDWPPGVEPLSCSWQELSKPKPSFPFLADGALAMSEETYWACEEIFPEACEFFPIAVEGESWVAVNVIDICNALDLSRSKVSDADVGKKVHDYVILGDRINMNVFKIPETAWKEVFTSTGTWPDSDQEFPRFYDENGWSGLIFEEVRVV